MKQCLIVNPFSPLGKQWVFVFVQDLWLICSNLWGVLVHVSSRDSSRLLEEDQEEEAWKVWTWRIPGADWWVLRKPRWTVVFCSAKASSRFRKHHWKGAKLHGSGLCLFEASRLWIWCFIGHLGDASGVGISYPKKKHMKSTKPLCE